MHMDMEMDHFFTEFPSSCLSPNFSNYLWSDCSNDIKKCVAYAMEILRPYMHTGMPEFNLPALDPFRLPEIRYEMKYGNFSGSFIAKNMCVEQTKEFQLKDASLDSVRGIFVMDLHFPELKIVSDVDVNFKVMFAEQNLIGSFIARAVNVDVRLTFHLNKEESQVANNSLNNVQTKKQVGDYSVQFDFQNDNCYDKIINGILNVNRQSYIASFMPIVERKTDVIFQHLALNVLKSDSFASVFNKVE